MKKKKLVLMGFILVAIASIALLMTFGVPGRVRGYSTTTQGERVVERKTEYEGGYTQRVRVRRVESFDSYKLVNFLVEAYMIAYKNSSVILKGISPYPALADCINGNVDNIGIAIIPNIDSPSVFIFHNDGGIVSGGRFDSRYDTRGELVDTRFSPWVGRSVPPNDEGLIGGYGFSWGTTSLVQEGIYCSLAVQEIADVVNGCLKNKANLLGENTRIVIFTEEGWIAFDRDGKAIAYCDWPKSFRS